MIDHKDGCAVVYPGSVCDCWQDRSIAVVNEYQRRGVAAWQIDNPKARKQPEPPEDLDIYEEAWE